MSSTYSYTATEGKRPAFDEHTMSYCWLDCGTDNDDLPYYVLERLTGGKPKLGLGNALLWVAYPTEAEALAAADAAALKAIADGVWTPEGGK